MKPITSEELKGYKHVRTGELVLNRMQASNGMFAVAFEDGLVSPDYAVFRILQPIEPSYFVDLFKTGIYRAKFRQESKGLGTGTSGFLRLYSDRFGTIQIPYPPEDEQLQIVQFIHAYDRKIRRFIRNKQRLIALLNEQKQAIINQAVTLGLDPNAPMKATGIEWMPEIPAHWEAALLKHVADVRFSGVDKYSHDHEIPVLLCNYTDVYKNDRIVGNMVLMQATATTGEIARLTLKGGDVIITKDSETPDDIAVPALVPENLPGVVCAYHLGILRPDPQRLAGEFLFRSIGSARIAEQFHVLATGVTRFALSKLDVKNAVIPLPSIDEQVAICEWITSACAPLNEAIQRVEDEIRLIREYRERLIADVVTGKLDVRDVALALPDADESLEDLEEENGDHLLEDDVELEDVEA